MAHFQVDTEQHLTELNTHLATHNYVNGDFPGADDVRIHHALKTAPSKEKFTEIHFWFYLLSAFTPAVREQWSGKPAVAAPAAKAAAPAKKEVKPEPKQAADEVDLFGDDDDEEATKKAAEAAAAKKAAAQAAPKPKKTVIAKTIIIFDVKVYEATDQELLERVAKKIKDEINPEGLVWGQEVKFTEVAYGAKKITLSMIVEDEKISSEDIFDIILSWEDDVQSVDTVSMQKV